MKIYKFQDTLDGNFAFILAASQQEAEATLKAITSLPFRLVGAKAPAEMPGPVVIVNNILPF